MIYDKVFNDTTDTLSFAVPGPAGTLRYQIDQTASYATAAAMDAAAGSAAIVGNEVGAVGQNTEVIDTSALIPGTWYIHLVWNNGADTVPASTAFTIAAADPVGLAQGSALVLGVGASIAAAAGASDGVAVVTAVGTTAGGVQDGAGASAGVATVSGIGAATVASSGSSAGVATVSGVGSTVSSFSPSSLFSGGERGGWYDPSDLSTLWKDTAGTDPVTADGDAVARIDDKSGNGNHLTQATSASRPLYKTDGTLHWLLFDGTDDFLRRTSVDFTSSNKVTVTAGARKLSDSAEGEIVGFGNPAGQAGSFALNASSGSSPRNTYGVAARGTSVVFSNTAQSYVAPHTATLTLTSDIGAPFCRLRVAGTQVINLTGSQGTGNLGTWNLTLGSRANDTLRFNGRLYGAIVRVATSTSGEISDTEAWMNGKSGL